MIHLRFANRVPICKRMKMKKKTGKRIEYVFEKTGAK